MDHLRSGVRDQPGQHGETPSLLKIQKILAGRGGLKVLLLKSKNPLIHRNGLKVRGYRKTLKNEMKIVKI